MLEIKNVSKRINDKNIVSNINISLAKGQIVALLGPNGAGKTTTIKLILGLLNPTTGEINIDSRPSKKYREEYIRNIGYVSDSPFFYEELTGSEFISFTCGLWGGIDINTKYHQELISKLHLDNFIDNPIHSYSYGMKKKLSVFISLIHNPNYIVMDEPFNGLDPTTTQQLYDIMQDASVNKKGILLSTHMLDVVEKYCTHLVIINKGEIILYDEVSNLKKDSSKSIQEIYLDVIDNDILYSKLVPNSNNEYTILTVGNELSISEFKEYNVTKIVFEASLEQAQRLYSNLQLKHSPSYVIFDAGGVLDQFNNKDELIEYLDR